MLLEVHDINTYYGLSHILFDVSLQVDKGEVVVLLGRNGAGKTTTMNSSKGARIQDAKHQSSLADFCLCNKSRPDKDPIK